MELFTELVKAVIALPIGALVYVPFLRLAARLLSLKPLSVGAAFVFGLILGVVFLVASLIYSLVMPDTNVFAETAVAITLSLTISSALAGYFVTASDGSSVGLRKGFYFTLVSQAFFGVALVLLAVIIVAIFSIGKI